MRQSEGLKARFRSFFCTFPVRLVTVYFVLQIIPFPFDSIPYFSFFTDACSKLFNNVVLWAGRSILRIPSFTITLYNGSGDRLFNYVSLFVIAVAALLIAIAWQLWDRNRDRSAGLLYLLRDYIQLYFGLVMIKYGLEKVIQMQFPFPYASLTKTYGESSPLQLMWNFIGYSSAYNLIIGVTEMLSGFLVLFRRTALAGALISIAALFNVAVLNFCYDVPVKLFSLNLLLMAVFIAAPDAKRLANFFLLNKPLPAKPVIRPLQNNKTWRLILAAKFFTATLFLWFTLQTVRLKYTMWGNGAFAQTPLFGIYEVMSFIKNGDTLPPLQPDTVRWKEISIIYKKEASIKLMNDTIRKYRLSTDTVHQKIEMEEKEDMSRKAVFSYTQPDPAHLLMTGRWHGDSVSLLLQKQDISRYPLISRGFHWINEYPHW